MALGATDTFDDGFCSIFVHCPKWSTGRWRASGQVGPVAIGELLLAAGRCSVGLCGNLGFCRRGFGLFRRLGFGFLSGFGFGVALGRRLGLSLLLSLGLDFEAGLFLGIPLCGSLGFGIPFRLGFGLTLGSLCFAFGALLVLAFYAFQRGRIFARFGVGFALGEFFLLLLGLGLGIGLALGLKLGVGVLSGFGFGILLCLGLGFGSCLGLGLGLFFRSLPRPSSALGA